MFESINEKSGDKALSKAATIFRVLGTLAVIGVVLMLFVRIGGDTTYNIIHFVWYPTFAALSFATAHGIEQQRMWGKRLGYALGFLSLVNIPIGTIIGVAIIIYIQRASKEGLFR